MDRGSSNEKEKDKKQIARTSPSIQPNARAYAAEDYLSTQPNARAYARRREIRSLMEDSGYSRKEAAALADAGF